MQSIVDHWRLVSPEPRYDPEWIDIQVEAAVEEMSGRRRRRRPDGASDPDLSRKRDQRASASYLQRRLKIGYNRAAGSWSNSKRKAVGPPDGPRGRQFLG
ncbi:MAG: DNA translocase FtsK [Thermomicrobiales bacterium]